MTLGKYKYNANEIPEQFSAVDGVRGKALHFPGGISLNANGGRKPSDFPGGNDSYTVSVWIKPAAAACTGTTNSPSTSRRSGGTVPSAGGFSAIIMRTGRSAGIS